jgi:hypothetical protein
MLDIHFPIEDFHKLSETINPQSFVQPEQGITEPKNKKIFQPKSLLESHYNFGGEHVAVQEYVENKQKPSISVTIQEVSLGFYESPSEHF